MYNSNFQVQPMLAWKRTQNDDHDDDDDDNSNSQVILSEILLHRLYPRRSDDSQPCGGNNEVENVFIICGGDKEIHVWREQVQ